MTISLYDVLGTLGVGLILTAYLLLQLGRIKSIELSYSLMNALGSGLILISLFFDFNFPSFLVEGFWLIISIIGLVKYFYYNK